MSMDAQGRRKSSQQERVIAIGNRPKERTHLDSYRKKQIVHAMLLEVGNLFKSETIHSLE